jgi:hypothetical protein
MTLEQETHRGTADHSVATLTTASRRTGDWGPVARWLAGTLNAIDSNIVGRLDSAGRAERDDLIDRDVDLAGGDRREFDVIVLRDGTRVCWHLGQTPGLTRWIVESPGERCR